MNIPSSKTHFSHSFIVQLDPRVRVVTSFAFAIFVALSEKFLTLGISLAFSLLLIIAAGIVNRRTCRRFIEFNAFTLLLLVFLPPSLPGRPLFSFGGLIWSVEGVFKTMKIAIKANSIMLAFAALIATMEPIQLGLALNRFGCPDKLAHILFFAVRYLDVIHREYTRLMNAIKLRCFRPGFNRHTFRTYGYLIGMLLLKSLDRSERILEAMKCRGFRNRFYTLTPLTFAKNDVLFVILWSGVIIFLSCIEWVLLQN
jgi:cobalt/nickel transport system permease protein